MLNHSMGGKPRNRCETAQRLCDTAPRMCDARCRGWVDSKAHMRLAEGSGCGGGEKNLQHCAHAALRVLKAVEFSHRQGQRLPLEHLKTVDDHECFRRAGSNPSLLLRAKGPHEVHARHL